MVLKMNPTVVLTLKLAEEQGVLSDVHIKRWERAWDMTPGTHALKVQWPSRPVVGFSFSDGRKTFFKTIMGVALHLESGTKLPVLPEELWGCIMSFVRA
jgi:hypothetical protein